MSSSSLPPNDSPVNPSNLSSQSSAQSRAQARSRFKLIPMSDDRAFPPDCDLLSIRYNTETKQYTLDSSTQETQYITGEAYITMRRFPGIALRNISRIKARLSGKVGMHPLVSASLAYGLSYLSRNKWIEELVKLNLRHNLSSEKLPGMINKMIDDSLSRYEISTPEGKYLNPQIHERTNNRLTSLAISLGVNKSSLASLAICYTVSEQINTNEDDKREMGKYVEGFFEASRIRGRALKSLMDTFEIPELEVEV